MKHIVTATLAVAVIALAGTACAERYGDAYRDDSAFGKMGNKLGRGAANVFTSVVEVPKNISNEWRKSDPVTGVIVGTVKGFAWWGTRVAVGAFEVVTFPVPVPANYEPLMYPEYPLADQWGKQLPYFDKTF